MTHDLKGTSRCQGCGCATTFAASLDPLICTKCEEFEWWIDGCDNQEKPNTSRLRAYDHEDAARDIADTYCHESADFSDNRVGVRRKGEEVFRIFTVTVEMEPTFSATEERSSEQ